MTDILDVRDDGTIVFKPKAGSAIDYVQIDPDIATKITYGTLVRLAEIPIGTDVLAEVLVDAVGDAVPREIGKEIIESLRVPEIHTFVKALGDMLGRSVS